MKHSTLLVFAAKAKTSILFVLLLGCFAGFSYSFAEELSKDGPTAFRLHRDGLNSADIADFNYGRGLFHHFWKPVEHGDGTSSGFGPLYNADACVACHIRDGRGHPPEAGNPDAVSFVLRLSTGSSQIDGYKYVLPDPVYGFQFQDHAIEGLRAEGQIDVAYQEALVTLSDGEEVSLRTPSYELVELGYGAFSGNLRLGPRIAPQLIGLGFLEDIPVQRLEELADAMDLDGDGISGRINWGPTDANGVRLPGRFGWKLTAVSVREQSDMAANADMGIATPFADHFAGDCTQAQIACVQEASPNHLGKDIELDESEMRLLAFYTANLRVPDRRNENDTNVILGELLFSEIGCAACHVPSHVLEDGQVISPYTDLLLHDMGEGLADGIEVGVAEFSEWRTPPLWGIGFTEIVSGHTFFLHDGRARNLSEAILWHGGEGEASRNRFMQLNYVQRQNLLSFLNSI